MKYTHIFFDLDGTLWDFETNSHETLLELCNTYNLNKKGISDYEKFIKTYKDHRMAMSFAPLSLKFGRLQINNVEVVNKSYPNFWQDLKKGGFIISPEVHSNI